VKWYWNFGDGNTKTETTGSPVTHTYATEGTYEVSLQVENQSGCKSTLFTGKQKLSVIARPVANFGFNEVCVNDPFAIFNDSSYVPGSGGSLIYAWDFGDANATPANPNTSDIQNPQHKYSVAGTYNVSLTAALPNGCSSTATKLFVVSSGSPKADFIIKNTGSICANTKVEIENTSSVDVGRITRIEIIWDQNTPASIVTDNDPVIGAIYSHTYPFLPTNQTYQVTFRSYSGQSCVTKKYFQ
jgi:PKD repeat protein